MAVDDDRKSIAFPALKQVEAQSRALVRSALKGALATVHNATGHPYASLVLTATEPDGTPVFLISRLALHTQNLKKDTRATMLVDGRISSSRATTFQGMFLSPCSDRRPNKRRKTYLEQPDRG